jgi:glycerol-3-phosphate dehydrogenase (NAD(P)+)
MIGIAGAGAFGTALAVALSASGREVCLWARPSDRFSKMIAERKTKSGLDLPSQLKLSCDIDDIAQSTALLLCIPTQKLSGFLSEYVPRLKAETYVTCCKGAEIGTGALPSEIVSRILPSANLAVLTGPGFAAEVVAGKPTAMTLATQQPSSSLQKMLSTQTLRLYVTDDLIGAQMGGALKNVVAIACGITIGANLGESARAAVLTRGFAEMQRYGATKGAQPETLMGLSGLGDLVLTCGSNLSRNFSHGITIGRGDTPEANVTVEGASTAIAIGAEATAKGIEMPITQAVASVLAGRLSVAEAISDLLARPLKVEV